MSPSQRSSPRNLLVSSHKKKKPVHKRVKVCLPCWGVAFCLLVFFTANLAFIYYDIEKNHSGFHEEHPLSKAQFPNSMAKRNNQVASLIQQHQQQQKETSQEDKKAKRKGPSLVQQMAAEMHQRPKGDRGENIIQTSHHHEGALDTTTSRAALYVQTLQDLEKSTGKQSCRKTKNEAYSFNGDFCTQVDHSYLYHNPLPFARYVCGTLIKPQSSVELSTKCNEPARVFPVVPDRTGKGMPPIQTGFGSPGGASAASSFPCDVPCQNRGSPSITCSRFVRGVDGEKDLTLQFSMEGPQYYSQLNIRADAWKQLQFYSTTSYQSEVPLPYYSAAEYSIRGQAVDYNKAIKGASFLARNCASRNKRETIVSDLQNSAFRVDSLSACLHNADPPPGVSLRNKVEVMKNYLFYLAFENQCVEDYITEKLWGPLESGTVPVYYGSPNVKDHVPNNSIIHVDDFPTTADLAAHLIKVSKNRTLYEEYHAWRTKPFPEHFHARYDFTEIHSTCRTCRWAFAKFYGLGWNHNNQSLRELEIPRTPCVNDVGLLSHPVIEEWLTDGNSKLESISREPATCPFEGRSTAVNVDANSIQRTLYVQDGVIDMLIEKASALAQKTVYLRLQTPFPASDEHIDVTEIQLGHIRLQGAKSRYTIISWPYLSTAVLKTDNFGGVVDIALPVDEADWPLRLRIIVEDVETLRDGADQEENYFARMMIRDFYEPVEILV